MKQILERLEKFRDDREWRELHTERELARALIIEAGELNELYLWGEYPSKKRLKEELADVLIYALNLCLVAELDPFEIINQKIDMNAVKYPLPTS